MTDSHVELPGSRRQARSTAVRVGDASPAAGLEVTVTLRGPSFPSADVLPQDAIDHDALAAAYGADPVDVLRARSVLERFGLVVPKSGVSLASRSLHAQGSVAQMEAAFRAGLGAYFDHGGEKFRGREGVTQVSAELEGIVTGVFGLDDRCVARHHSGGQYGQSPLGPSDL